MSWEYRVVQVSGKKEDSFQIHEIYYDDEDQVESWTGPMEAYGEDHGELQGVLFAMFSASLLPAILQEDLKVGLKREDTLIDISSKSLKVLDESMKNFKKGKVSNPVDMNELSKLLKSK